ncbi:MAG TPA: hypothetical protein VFQ54_00045, partial [Thermomicrobiales bacterium]|nr:hypothetical protein [Thermomicrobiales bacterium]
LYLTGLSDLSQADLNQLKEYSGFTDIEFNPKRSFNCQARSCALAATLLRLGLFDQALSRRESYMEIVWGDSGPIHESGPTRQPELF